MITCTILIKPFTDKPFWTYNSKHVDITSLLSISHLFYKYRRNNEIVVITKIWVVVFFFIFIMYFALVSFILFEDT